MDTDETVAVFAAADMAQARALQTRLQEEGLEAHIDESGATPQLRVAPEFTEDALDAIEAWEAEGSAVRPAGAGAAFRIFFIWLLGQIGGGVVGGVAVAMADVPFSVAMLLGSLAGGVAVVVATASRFKTPEERRDLGLVRATGPQCAAGLVLGLLVAVGLFVCAIWVFPPAPDMPTNPLVEMAQSTRLGLAIWFVIAVLIAPTTEELLFRGVMLRGFARSWGTRVAAVSVTVAFVLMHVTQAIDYPPALVFIGLMSVTALALRMRTGSLIPAVLAHFAYNSAIVGLAAM